MQLPRKYHRPLLYLIGILLACILSWIGFLVNPEITFVTPYFLLCVYFVWFLGLWPGVITAIALGILSVVTGALAGVQYNDLGVPLLKIFIRSGIFLSLVIILHALKTKQKKLNEALKEIKQKNTELENFASAASHDLQTPLSTIKMLCQLIEKNEGNKKKYLDQINESATRMLQLIRNLLSYAKTAQAKKSIQQIHLRDIINELIKDLGSLIKEKNGKIEVGELPVIKADPTQMRQLFQNLIGNALKYSKETETPSIKISSIRINDYVEIYVQDNGVGFNEDSLEKIFTPFQRLSNDPEGTGIGLPICKKIVEQHGGEITAKSTPNIGSTFIIKLPLYTE